ncbi:LPXTG cell wall anchor domain-containing protein [Streptococcus sp. OH4692_COT-348]|nr:LPXTG cell wall anchor domain-containing protein [Streptococcus sp. OH4692_COT-348]
MDYIFCIHSINFVHKSLHYWTRDCFKNNRRSLLMKTKSTINLFATTILATATISAVNVATHPSNVFASEVTQVPNKNNVGTHTTFETDPVFKNFEEGEKYLDNYVKPTIENSRYGYFTASVVPDGLGGNYLVSGFIDSHSEDEEVIKGNKETAQKIVKNAGIDLTNLTNQSNGVLTGKITETQRDGFPTVTFETDAVFKNFDEANSYAEGHGAEILDATKGYKDYSLKAEPALNGTSNYLVSGEIRAYKDYSGASVTAEQAKKNIEAAARKVVNDAKPSISTTKPVTPAKPVEEVKPATPTKPVDEGKTSNDIKKIDGEFTEIKTTSTGLTFKAKLYEELPHDGPYTPNIHATLTDKATGKEVAKTSVVLEGLSEGLKKADALFYANLLEGIIFEPSLTPGNYVLTVEGTAGATYGQNTDKRKRYFIFSTEVTLTGENNTTTTTQPEKTKDSTTKPKSDQTTNNVNNNQQPSNDKNKQTTNNNTGKQDKNELSTNKTSDTKTDKQNSDNTLSQEKQQATSTSTKPENDKNTLPNTGESTSILDFIGTVLSITGLGFIVKRKRG